jgi:hypothetical protein
MSSCIIPATKRCSHCKQNYPSTSEFFRRNKSTKDGLQKQCKMCHSESDKAYRARHPEKAGETSRRNALQYRANNLEKVNANTVQWRENNREYTREYSRRYRQSHHEQHLTSTRKWCERNPAKRRAINMRKEARKRNLPHTFTADAWQRCLQYFDNKCAICGRSAQLGVKIAQDHWIPESKGGGYTPDNIIPLCHGFDGCNNKKWANDPVDWLISRYGDKAQPILDRILDYLRSVS